MGESKQVTERSLRHFKKRVKWAWRLVFVVFFISVVSKFFLPSEKSESVWLLIWFFGPNLFAGLVLLIMSHCPGCGHLFYTNKFGVINPWRKDCGNCGMRFGSQ